MWNPVSPTGFTHIADFNQASIELRDSMGRGAVLFKQSTSPLTANLL